MSGIELNRNQLEAQGESPVQDKYQGRASSVP